MVASGPAERICVMGDLRLVIGAGIARWMSAAKPPPRAPVASGGALDPKLERASLGLRGGPRPVS